MRRSALFNRVRSAFFFPVLTGLTAAGLAARTLTVDPRDPQAFRTLGEAAAQVKPGDTLRLAPGSGPYREVLYIRVPGTPEAPIVIEGGGNEVTGFDPLVFGPAEDGRRVATVKTEYPFVLRHDGKRMPESAVTGAFGGGVSYDRAAGRLVLATGTPADGWEISVRPFAVRVSGVSHHLYRNLIATGSRNDGFNLHGDGEGLVFESITGSQNLDEGFSSHDQVRCEIRGGRFFENDNGLLNGQQTVTRLEQVDVHDNLGFGLGFNGEARVEAGRVRVWGNGLLQVLLRKGVQARFEATEVYRNPRTDRPWVTYMESARWGKPVTLSLESGVTWLGTPLAGLAETAPAGVSAR